VPHSPGFSRVKERSTVERCTCQYNEAYKKCGRYAYACKDIARMERDACYGMCVTDYTY